MGHIVKHVQFCYEPNYSVGYSINYCFATNTKVMGLVNVAEQVVV